jgi:hypothetical protein
MKLSTNEGYRYYFLKLAIRWSSYIRRAAEQKVIIPSRRDHPKKKSRAPSSM